ncbi:MAG TPA: hypothetical protein P5323_03470 [Candidatus Moranbacteria bacterium]|nr:hypothetical protein [Candidatus Moranbacteria bacterium]HRY28171.1 hypothetical protein [Candidatus Moranbacteria bacterium]HSA08634.1 hypothetical protein [Candidatus Moranbacteria bacterium]
MLKTWLKKISIIVLELAVVAGLLWFIAQKKGINNLAQIAPGIEQTVQNAKQKFIPFPELSQSVVKKFQWEYKGKKYSLEKTLHQSVYDYYKSKPKEYSYSAELPANWEEEYYAMFLKSDPADPTIAELVNQIKELGKKNNLSDDQIVELAIGFVQTIPYDDAKAANILQETGNEEMLYPYEVLWDQSGVCSDKSLLAYALLREMGYGVALFEFEQEKHMAAAVECPQNYSNYDSGYCFVETTSTGNKIGIIPDFDMGSGKAAEVKQLTDYDSVSTQTTRIKELGQVKIILPKEGKEYAGIIQTQKIANQIVQLKKDMQALSYKIGSLKNVIDGEVEDLEDMQDDLKKYKKEGNIEKYNTVVEKYNNLLEEYKKDLEKYNSSVTLYNADVKKYNTLIKQ